MDGHEKVATRCYDEPPVRGRRPRKDGTVKLQNVGWFMVTDPKTGVILGVDEMKTAENSDIALKMVEKLRPLYPYVNCTIYDSACAFLKKAKQRKSLNGIRFWCIDKFHARSRGKKCECSPNVHKHLARRLKKANTSISEQTFAWFRGYATTFNTMNANAQRFYVIAYSRRHNGMMRNSDRQHLNPWAAHKQAMRKAGVFKKPASTSYGCKAVRKHHLKRPAQK